MIHRIMLTILKTAIKSTGYKPQSSRSCSCWTANSRESPSNLKAGLRVLLCSHFLNYFWSTRKQSFKPPRSAVREFPSLSLSLCSWSVLCRAGGGGWAEDGTQTQHPQVTDRKVELLQLSLLPCLPPPFFFFLLLLHLSQGLPVGDPSLYRL